MINAVLKVIALRNRVPTATGNVAMGDGLRPALKGVEAPPYLKHAPMLYPDGTRMTQRRIPALAFSSRNG